MCYAYQAYKGTQLIEFAGFVGQIRRSRRIRHNKRTLYCLFYRLLVNNNAAINVQTPISPAPERRYSGNRQAIIDVQT